MIFLRCQRRNPLAFVVTLRVDMVPSYPLSVEVHSTWACEEPGFTLDGVWFNGPEQCALEFDRYVALANGKATGPFDKKLSADQ